MYRNRERETDGQTEREASNIGIWAAWRNWKMMSEFQILGGGSALFQRQKQPVLDGGCWPQGWMLWASVSTLCPTLGCSDSQTYTWNQSLARLSSSKYELPRQDILLVLKEIAWSSWQSANQAAFTEPSLRAGTQSRVCEAGELGIQLGRNTEHIRGNE